MEKMEKILKLVVLLNFVCALPAQAQRVIKPTVHTPRAFTRAHLSAYRSIYGAPYPSVALHPALPLPAGVEIDRDRMYETVTSIQQRSWFEQQQRNFKAWQLKKERSQRWALYQQLDALPKLRAENVFETADLRAFRVDFTTLQEVPAPPVIKRPGYLYRGMGLRAGGADLVNIFQNGLRVQDVGPFSNALLLSLTNTSHEAALVAGMKYINLTHQPDLAVSYALRNSRALEEGVATVAIVTGQQEYGPVVRVTQDIAPEQIEAVLALLNINDTPTWCLVEWYEGRFIVTPYANK